MTTNLPQDNLGADHSLQSQPSPLPAQRGFFSRIGSPLARFLRQRYSASESPLGEATLSDQDSAPERKELENSLAANQPGEQEAIQEAPLPRPVVSPQKVLWRESFLVTGLLFGLSLVAGRLIYIQGIRGEEFNEKAVLQQLSKEQIVSRPGDLLDRHGRLLATTISVASVYANPQKIEDVDAFVAEISHAVSLDPERLRERLIKNQGRQFLWIKRRLRDSEAVALQQRKFPPGAVGIKREFQRHYPHGHLAMHVLGMRDIDGVGRGGVEQAFDSVLSGEDGVRRFVRDARGYVLEVLEEITEPPVNGQSVALTLDVFIQWKLEHELDLIVQQHQPLGACAIVMNPRNGEILGMGSRPVISHGSSDDTSDEGWKNLAISAAYEPGSTFKPLVVAWGLDSGVIHRDEEFHCGWGRYQMGNRLLRDHHSYGVLSLSEVLAKSSNVGMAKIGERLGNEQLYHLTKAFGMGQPTGIEIPGEISGLVHPLSQWTRYSTGSIPMGQEFTATPLQMLTAHAVLANGGKRITPRLLKRVDQQAELLRPVMISQVVSSENSRWVVEKPMTQVVTDGTGKLARIQGVPVFGKTGTSQKVNLDGPGYSQTRHVSSFVCGAPSDHPELLVIVCVDEPVGDQQFGGAVAAPYAASILKFAMEIDPLNNYRSKHPLTRMTRTLQESGSQPR